MQTIARTTRVISLRRAFSAAKPNECERCKSGANIEDGMLYAALFGSFSGYLFYRHQQSKLDLQLELEKQKVRAIEAAQPKCPHQTTSLIARSDDVSAKVDP